MLAMKLVEAINGPTNRTCVITQWKEEMVLGKRTLGA